MTSRPACGRSEVSRRKKRNGAEIGRPRRREEGRAGGREGGRERERSKQGAREGWKDGWTRGERMPRINATARPGGQNLRIPAGYIDATRYTIAVYRSWI